MGDFKLTSRDFCYWLQGFFEITGGETPLTAAQATMVQKHLNLVFIHEIDPTFGGKAEQDKLNTLHGNLPDGIARC